MNDFSVYVPISLDLDWPSKESIVEEILEQHREYNISKFVLTAPSGGWRSVGYAPKEFFIRMANDFKWVKEQLSPYGIELGWWITATLKSGRSENFQGIVKEDGGEHAFANCPLDKNFIERFSSDVADFATIAKPSLIITEDDYSLVAAMGCYCPLHIAEFNKRYGFNFTKKELLSVLKGRNPESLEIIRKWRELRRDSLAELATAVRNALDVRTPEIPMGYMQAGGADIDGDCTEAVARAFAGKNHTPFIRLFGAEYSGIKSKEIPNMVFHLLYSKEHLPSDICCLLEADTFPHTRFYTSGKNMMAAMAAAYSYGCNGATFQTQQIIDGANEEKAYGLSWKKYKPMFKEVNKTVKDCKLKGVEIAFDPFYSTLDAWINDSCWTRSVAAFGIPYKTTDSDILFWDVRRAKYATDADIKAALSKNLFLDGDAAKVLYNRGYGEYLGVKVGEDLRTLKGQELLWCDLGSREVIKPEFAKGMVGSHMPCAYILSDDKVYELEPTNTACEVITEYYNYKQELISPTMTRFENKLGGKVVVMALTVLNNRYQILFNYRRMKLFKDLIKWCGGEYIMAQNDPEVFIIENESVDKKDFKELLTLINLGEDEIEGICLSVPENLRENLELSALNIDGTWKKVDYTKTETGIKINHTLKHVEPLFLKFI